MGAQGAAAVCDSDIHTYKANSSCCPLRPHTTPFSEEKPIPGVIYGVLLWADMNAATPLGAWGRSAMSLAYIVVSQVVLVRPHAHPPTHRLYS